MMSTLVDFLRLFAGFMLQVFPYAFLCILPFSDNLRFKHGKAFTYTFVILCALIFSICTILILNTKSNNPTDLYQLINTVFMALFLLCILYYCYIVKVKPAVKLYVICYIATFAFFVSLLTTVLWQSKIYLLFPPEFDTGIVYGISYDIFLLLSTVVIFPIGLLLVKKQLVPTIKSMEGKQANYFALFSVILLILLALSFSIFDYAFVGSTMAIIFCLALCFVVVIAYFSGSMLIQNIRHTNELKIDLLTSKYNNDIISQQYKHIQENIENQRALRHNFRQQLITLRGLCEQSDADIRKYLNEYLKCIPNYEFVPLCHNAVFNSILNYYKTTAENKGFTFNCNINLPVCVEISEIDVVTIIGNILENAIAAGSEMPPNERIISINIDYSNKMIGIAIDNSFNGNVKTEEGKYISTKHEGTAYGLQSIQIIADKYNGTAEFSHKDNMFYSSVMLVNASSKCD